MAEYSNSPDLGNYMTKTEAAVEIAQMQADIKRAKDEVFALPNVTLAGQIALGVAAGPRKHTVACVGALPTDRLVATPNASLGAGYMIGDASCTVADQVEVTVYLPAVTVLSNYSVGARITALRPA